MIDTAQLRKDAEQIKDVMANGLYLCQEPRKLFTAKVIEMCDHILATVREDDGEAITEKWLDTFAKREVDGVWNIDTKKMRNDAWVIKQKDRWELSWQDYEDNTHGEWPYLLKTRGQLRRLLESLGLPTHEK